MQHRPTLELAKLAVRARICPHCYQRPHDTETLPAHVPRSCEPTCTIFMHLPRLESLVEQHLSLVLPVDDVIRNFICSSCTAAPTAGEFCSERLARTCPLSRHAVEAIRILEDLTRNLVPSAPRQSTF